MNSLQDTLLQLIEHLKACVDVASSRTANWQKFCVKHAQVLPFLMQISFKLDDGVNPIVLQLLQSAICNMSQNHRSQVRRSIISGFYVFLVLPLFFGSSIGSSSCLVDPLENPEGKEEVSLIDKLGKIAC